MARARSIDKYPIAAYAELFTLARQAADSGKTYRLLCETKKDAMTRRFEFYSFIRALSKSAEPAAENMAKEFRGFKLTLMPTGDGDKTYIQFEAWDRTALAQDIMAQIAAFRAETGILPDTQAQAQTTQAEEVASPYAPISSVVEETGSAQMDAFRKLGYGGTPKK